MVVIAVTVESNQAGQLYLCRFVTASSCRSACHFRALHHLVLHVCKYLPSQFLSQQIIQFEFMFFFRFVYIYYVPEVKIVVLEINRAVAVSGILPCAYRRQNNY